MKRNPTISDINRTKYLLPPGWDLINQFINELGVTRYQFERFYHIPFNTISQVKSNARQLPAPYWHIFYERIKPAYGAGFLGDYPKMKTKNKIKVPTTKKQNTIPCKHGRLSMVSKSK